MLVNIGKGIELDVNTDQLGFDKLGPVAAHIAKIGLRNILMDSHASVTAEKVGAGGDVMAESRAVAEKKLAAMYAGDVRTASGGERDPVRSEVHAAIKKAGKKPADYDAKAIREKAVANIEKFMATARENVERAKALNVEIDAGDLPIAAE
jgi:hypothetical protein